MRFSGEALRVFQCAFEEKPCDGVIVVGGYLTTEAHCFQRNRAATGEHIQDMRRLSTVSLLDEFSGDAEFVKPASF